MDTPRRWQVASLATAVTSLGIGGLIISRPSVEPVAPIVLDVRAATEDTDLDPTDLEDVDVTTPEFVEADVVTPQTPASLTSIDSPDDPASVVSRAPAPSPSPTASSPSTTRTAPADDSPDSVDSVRSIDSDD